MNGLSAGKILAIVISVLALALSPFILMSIVENVDASEIMVVQSPIDGTLSVYTEPGLKPQWFGKVTKYQRREQYSFSSASSQGSKLDDSIKTGFNDGGSGRVSGVMSWEMPLKPDAVVRLHKEYGSFHAIDQQLIRPMLEKVIFSAGATMSSIESSSERRPEIPQTIDDQLQNGPYLTTVAIVNQKDPVTDANKPVRVVQIVVDKEGKPTRASSSTIKEYGITLSPVTINDIVYEDSVKSQIAERQKSTQAVQLSIAAAVRASQDAITTERQGQAAAAKTKWEQEAVKAKEVTLAQQKLAVAELAAKEAEQYKREQILRGEGDAQRRQLVMNADGALDKKLEAYVNVQQTWAEAFSKFQGQMVPSVQMGGQNGGSNAVTSAQTFMDILTARAAKDIGLDMSASGVAKTVKK